MVKIFGLTTDGLLPSKAKAEVEGIATVKAEGAVSDVRATAELASEKVRDLAVPVAKATLTPGFDVAPGSPDIRVDLQAALDAAANGGDTDYWGFLRRMGTRVTLAPGVYRVSAPPDGSPSIVVPRGVALDFSGTTLVFEYPTAGTNWAGILAHSQAVVTVGNMRTTGEAPDDAHVYDGVRVYHGDNGNNIRGGVISNFQGAAIRLLGSYVTRITGLRAEFCSHGVVHGHSNGLVTDGQGAYTLPTVEGEAIGSSRRPTDLWIQDCIFDSTKGDVIIVGAVGSKDQPNALDWSNKNVTGGNLYCTHVLIEGTPARAVWARELSQLVLDDFHMEEVGTHAGAMIDTDVVYGNVVVGPMRINITGSRMVENLTGQQVYVTPAGIFQAGGFGSFSCKDVYLRNDLGDLWFSGPEPWDGAWGDVEIGNIRVDLGSSGMLLHSDLMNRGTTETAGGDPRITEAIRLTETAKTSENAYHQAVTEAQQAAAGTTVYQTSFEDTAEWTPSYGSWVYSDAVLAANGSHMARLPANNTNTTNGKPVHMYGKADVPVLQGRKYMIRAKLRTMGAPGDTDTFQVLLAKASGATQTFWLISAKLGLKTSGVGQDRWTDVEIPWTATETATLRLGPQGSFLAADLLVDQMVFADVTEVQDLSGPVNTAREKWDADEAAAVEAWSAIMPTTAIGSGGGGTVTVTRAEYDQLALMGGVDPDVTYLVTL